MTTSQFSTISKLAVWPNPAQNTIQFSGAEVTEVRVFDLLGKQVLSQNLDSENTAVEVSNLANGMYLVQATDSNGALSTVKFMKN